MRIEEFIRHLLETMPSDGWSQISRGEIIRLATYYDVADPVLCADACHAIGIGELMDHEQAGEVVFTFERSSS